MAQFLVQRVSRDSTGKVFLTSNSNQRQRLSNFQIQHCRLCHYLFTPASQSTPFLLLRPIALPHIAHPTLAPTLALFRGVIRPAYDRCQAVSFRWIFVWQLMAARVLSPFSLPKFFRWIYLFHRTHRLARQLVVPGAAIT